MAVTAKCVSLSSQFEQASERELETALELAAIGKDWPSVYWHAGFAIENLLKAIRVKKEGLEKWPDMDKSAKWHDIEYVADRAGLKEQLKHERKNRSFAANWLTVKDWDQSRRYPGNTVTKSKSMDLLHAVRNPNNGVMACLRRICQSI